VRGSLFLHIFWLYFKGDIKRNLDIFILSVLLISVLSGVMVISATYKYRIGETLKSKADFILQKRVAGVALKTPTSWIDELYEIRGIDKITPRLFINFKEDVTLLGVDFLEDSADREIERLIKEMDLKRFLSKEYALVPKNLAKRLKIEDFITINGRKVEIYPLREDLEKLIPKNTVVMEIETLKEMLGWNENYVSDITFNVPNEDEWSMIESKLDSLHYTSFTVSKSDIDRAYSKMFGFKEGFFLMMYLIVIATFTLILYSRYSRLYSQDRRTIGILRGIGWSIKDILLLKFLEVVSVIIISFMVGVGVGYTFLYLFDGTLFGKIFLDHPIDREFIFRYDFGVLFSIFLIYAVPFVASTLIPVWRVAITEPREVML
jgi:ABC-type lipoprotein release transport system permease subunit